MGNYHYIPKATKENMVLMSAFLKPTIIARLLQVSPRTVYRVLELSIKRGVIINKSQENGRPRLLDGLDLAYLEGCVERSPTITIDELQTELEEARGVLASRSTLSRALHRRGWTRKKASVAALERNEDRRAAYQIHVAEQYRPDQLVFVDESACNRLTPRRHVGWAPIGTRARRRDHFIRGTRYSILPAISLDGVLHLDILDRSWKGADFNGFIDGLLDNMQPFPAPNSVVVMDNASIHKSERLEAIVEARGMRLLYLPPYSPDFNPIEEGFSALKAWIRRNDDFCRGELTGEVTCDPFEMLWQGVFESMTSDSIHGWFRDCCYMV